LGVLLKRRQEAIFLADPAARFPQVEKCEVPFNLFKTYNGGKLRFLRAGWQRAHEAHFFGQQHFFARTAQRKRGIRGTAPPLILPLENTLSDQILLS
jgi:hypothetical protein